MAFIIQPHLNSGLLHTTLDTEFLHQKVTEFVTLGITNYELPEPGCDACSMSQRRVTLHSRITFVTLLTWSNTFSSTNTPSFNSCWVWGISFCNSNDMQIEILWTFSRLSFLLNNQPFHGKLLQHTVKDKHALPLWSHWKGGFGLGPIGEREERET